MIIYYHCTSDNPLLLYIIFTNLPSLHPLSFHEMIFILVQLTETNPNKPGPCHHCGVSEREIISPLRINTTCSYCTL